MFTRVIAVCVNRCLGGSLSDRSCTERQMLARCVSPYLYPCTIQYAIVASGLLLRLYFIIFVISAEKSYFILFLLCKIICQAVM